MTKKNDFKPIENLTFEIISISKSDDSNSLIYDLKFNNYDTEKEVIILHVNEQILNIITSENELVVGKELIFNITPSTKLFNNATLMMFLEIGYGAKQLRKGESYKNAHIAFASTIYKSLELYNINYLFQRDSDIQEHFEVLYKDIKSSSMIIDKDDEKTTIIECELQKTE